ncbi:sugar kinase [Novosphingobium sp. JCM 18896]|uniref:sugar kinase n=1 Tax=Novosphingobium sp. JCM 18896 TaxID=2989731 RepID=UPI0022224229|nr:sugar kinase [Novosphingobium sp. JCM 18896]MCW1429501.1 sugar kinase [Novosphingobium sp. JCM 18896]
MARIVCIGEGMLELSRRENDWQLDYGGDTLNTAIHLARAGHDVAYLTALGADPFSVELKAQWRAEGIDTSLVLTHPTRQAGLYAITTDAAGERSFTYWRDTSAAREMFALPESDAMLAQAERADLVYFSLITLAILPPEGRQRLLALAASARRVAFDGNYRPRLWQNQAETRAARDAAIALADIGLPTWEDETTLSGEPDAEAVARHWTGLGCSETVVKLGAEGCRLPNGTLCAPERVLQPVDTSGAGDAFNAGYLDARLKGASPADAARAGHALAGWTIMLPGAIPPRES